MAGQRTSLCVSKELLKLLREMKEKFGAKSYEDLLHAMVLYIDAVERAWDVLDPQLQKTLKLIKKGGRE